MSFTFHVNSNLLYAGLFVAESAKQFNCYKIMKSPKTLTRRNTIFLVEQVFYLPYVFGEYFLILIMFKPTLNAFIHEIHCFKFANLYSKNVLEQKHEYFCRSTHSVHIQKETNTEQIPHRKIRKSKYQKPFWQHEGEMTERKREIERQTNVLYKFPLYRRR